VQHRLGNLPHSPLDSVDMRGVKCFSCTLHFSLDAGVNIRPERMNQWVELSGPLALGELGGTVLDEALSMEDSLSVLDRRKTPQCLESEKLTPLEARDCGINIRRKSHIDDVKWPGNGS
jgi:hypothetical protein